MNDVIKKEVGRPTLYRQEMCNDVEQWAKMGIVNHEIAKRLNISEATLYEWKDKYIEFSESFKKGNDYRHQNVINALYKRAMGYQYDEITQERIVPDAGENGKQPETELVVTKRVTKQQAPDVAAAIFYLINRVPEEWRNKTDVNSNITGDVTLKTSSLTDQEKLDLIRMVSEKQTIEALPTTTYSVLEDKEDAEI